MNNQNRPETMMLDDQKFGSHIEHWQLLTEQPNAVLPQWLSQALDAPIMPMGICSNETEMDDTTWLIQGPKQQDIFINQVIAVEGQRPKALKTAFPSFDSPYKVSAHIERIIESQNASQAVLRLNLGNNNIAYAFDTLYSVNRLHYQKQQQYSAQLNAWAYKLSAVDEHEQLVVDDPASIKQHRALNDILAANNGVAPANLQEQIDAWQPKTEDDTAPVTVDFSKMVAYLYGENAGQQDEAWFQGKIVGKSTLHFMQQEFCVYDVTLFHELHQQAVLMRVATAHSDYKNFQIGQYVRGNIWLQVSIYKLDNE